MQAKIAPFDGRTGPGPGGAAGGQFGAGGAAGSGSGGAALDDVECWSEARVLQWLSDVKLEDYTGVFGMARINGAALLQLTDNDLNRIGVVDPMRRRELLLALETLNAEHVFYGSGAERHRLARNSTGGVVSSRPGTAGSDAASATRAGQLSNAHALLLARRIAVRTGRDSPLGWTHVRDTSVPALRDLVEPPPTTTLHPPLPLDVGPATSGMVALDSALAPAPVSPSAPAFSPTAASHAESMHAAAAAVLSGTPDAASVADERERIFKRSTFWWKVVGVVCALLSMLGSQWVVLGGEMHRFEYGVAGVPTVTALTSNSSTVAMVHGRVVARASWDRYEAAQTLQSVTTLTRQISPTLIRVLRTSTLTTTRTRYWYSSDATTRVSSPSGDPTADFPVWSAAGSDTAMWCFWCAAQSVLAFACVAWFCSLVTLVLFALRQLDRRTAIPGLPACIADEYFVWHAIEKLATVIGLVFYVLVLGVWRAVCAAVHREFVDSQPAGQVIDTGFVLVVVCGVAQLAALVVWRITVKRDERSQRRLTMFHATTIAAHRERLRELELAQMLTPTSPIGAGQSGSSPGSPFGANEADAPFASPTAAATAAAAPLVPGSGAAGGSGGAANLHITSIRVRPAADPVLPASFQPAWASQLRVPSKAGCGDCLVLLLAVFALVTSLCVFSGGGDIHRYAYTYDLTERAGYISRHRVEARAYWDRRAEQDTVVALLDPNAVTPLIAVDSNPTVRVLYYRNDQTATLAASDSMAQSGVQNVNGTSVVTVVQDPVVVAPYAFDFRAGTIGGQSFAAAGEAYLTFGVFAFVSSGCFLFLFALRLLDRAILLSPACERLASFNACRWCCRLPNLPPFVDASGTLVASEWFPLYLQFEFVAYGVMSVSFLLMSSIWGGQCYGIDRDWLEALTGTRGSLAGDGSYATLIRDSQSVTVSWLGVIAVATAGLVIGCLYLWCVIHSRDFGLHRAAAAAAGTGGARAPPPAGGHSEASHDDSAVPSGSPGGNAFGSAIPPPSGGATPAWQAAGLADPVPALLPLNSGVPLPPAQQRDLPSVSVGGSTGPPQPMPLPAAGPPAEEICWGGKFVHLPVAPMPEPVTPEQLKPKATAQTVASPQPQNDASERPAAVAEAESAADPAPAPQPQPMDSRPSMSPPRLDTSLGPRPFADFLQSPHGLRAGASPMALVMVQATPRKSRLPPLVRTPQSLTRSPPAPSSSPEP